MELNKNEVHLIAMKKMMKIWKQKSLARNKKSVFLNTKQEQMQKLTNPILIQFTGFMTFTDLSYCGQSKYNEHMGYVSK